MRKEEKSRRYYSVRFVGQIKIKLSESDRILPSICLKASLFGLEAGVESECSKM